MAKNKGRPENLIPLTVNDERAREIRSKGGKARVQKLHERKKMREDLGNLLKITLRRGDIVDPDDIMNMEEAEDLNIPVQTAIHLAMIKRALMGDVQAAQYIRDTVGEKPTDKVEMDQSLTIESWAKSHDVKL